MVDFSLLKPTMLADVVGIILIVVVVIVAFVLLWLDYRHYIEKYGKREFRFIEFVKNEGLYLFLLLMFVFLIGGEILLYHIFKKKYSLGNAVSQFFFVILQSFLISTRKKYNYEDRI